MFELLHKIQNPFILQAIWKILIKNISEQSRQDLFHKSCHQNSTFAKRKLYFKFVHQYDMLFTVADPRQGGRALLDPNSFIRIQFLTNILPHNRLVHPLWRWRLHLEILGSATSSCQCIWLTHSCRLQISLYFLDCILERSSCSSYCSCT